MFRAALPFAVLMLSPLSALAAPAPRVTATPSDGPPPLMVGFDTSGTRADADVAEHFLFTGNGDLLTLQTAAEMPIYGYQLPGFYLAQSWLRQSSGSYAASPTVPIVISRPRDGARPAALTLEVQATTDPLTFAFTPTVTAAAGDEVAARRWDFGDGATSGEATPFHTYARPGIYQALLVVTSRAGMASFARSLVAPGALGPSLLVAVSPEDATPLTPLRLSAYVEGASGAKVLSAEVAWPDLDDAAPAVTPTMNGITVSSDHGFATPGYYDVPVTVRLDGQPTPLVGVAHVTVARIDGSSPSPVLLMAPSGEAAVGKPYEPNGANATGRGLVVAGAGPFAFGAVAPSPAGFSVDDGGNLSWTPTRAQAGTQRLAVRIVDADGRQLVRSWVVQVGGAKAGGCALAAGAPAPPWWLLAALGLGLAWRRRARAASDARAGSQDPTP